MSFLSIIVDYRHRHAHTYVTDAATIFLPLASSHCILKKVHTKKFINKTYSNRKLKLNIYYVKKSRVLEYDIVVDNTSKF